MSYHTRDRILGSIRKMLTQIETVGLDDPEVRFTLVRKCATLCQAGVEIEDDEERISLFESEEFLRIGELLSPYTFEVMERLERERNERDSEETS